MENASMLNGSVKDAAARADDDRIISVLERLVGFPTVSSESNTDLVAYVDDYLRRLGLDPVILPDPEGTKANIHVTIGPQAAGGVVLSGHTDVVPVEGQAWTSDPFGLVRRENRLFGRGSADMKGFLAVVLALVPDMLAAGLKRPIHLVFSYDEETTCEGVLPMIDDIGRTRPPVSAVVVGEPTRMALVNAHKGSYGFVTRVTGLEAHSSLIEDGVSAISLAARLIVAMEDRMRARARAQDPTSRFDPGYTTAHAGTIRGGTAGNILAGGCEFVWELRTVPGDDADRLLEEFEADGVALLEALGPVAAQCRIETIQECAVPALRPEPGGEAEALCRRLTGRNRTEAVSYCTESGQFQAAGLSTIVIGPGSIEQAHKPDEFIEISELHKCAEFIRRLTAELAG
ncbi:MAG: acetylornithine deacetylase [Pseudomonadota bacterium]